jgi:CheY-like chemotaxis protein
MLLSKRHVEPRVLLIEDAEETRELSRLALESQACHVVGVSSPKRRWACWPPVSVSTCCSPTSIWARSAALKPPTGCATLPQLPILVTSGMDQHRCCRSCATASISCPSRTT